MQPQKRAYLTVTLPYVNSAPHIGYAMEIIQADFVARHRRLLGEEVFFNAGTDEHGLKIYRKAEERGISAQQYVDEYAAKFRGLQGLLGLSEDLRFVRTTDPHHKAAAQEFWKRCAAAGDIYKKLYEVKYCVGCELEKTDSELVDGRCPIHPNLAIELIKEENYFFRFSRHQQALLDLYEKQPDFVVPASRLNEIKAFVGRGLQDFSVSRLKAKMPWGVDVPGDPEQVMYVWFDALANYVSTIGWPESAASPSGDFYKWWPVVQFAGKDNLRQQSAMWQAMLLSAGIAPSRQIVIHGFITSGGQKMSKSLGNVIDPVEVVSAYGAEALRYYVARALHPFEDSDFTMERFKEAYNANLANSLGNTVSRVMKMATGNGVSLSAADVDGRTYLSGPDGEEVKRLFAAYEYNRIADLLWGRIAAVEQEIALKKPFSLVKTDPAAAKEVIRGLLSALYGVAVDLEPFMPASSRAIRALVKEGKMPESPLFMRKE